MPQSGGSFSCCFSYALEFTRVDRLVGRLKIYIHSVDIFCCIGLFKFSCVLLLCRYFLLVIYLYFLAFGSVEVTIINLCNFSLFVVIVLEWLQ